MGNTLNCASDRPIDQRDKKRCIILKGDIKDQEDIKKILSRYNDNSNQLRHIIYPYGERSALLIFEKKVGVKQLKKCTKLLNVKRLHEKEVDYLVPDALVKRARNLGQMETLHTNLKEMYGIEVSKQHDKVYLIGVSSKHIFIAKNYLEQFLEKCMNMKQNQESTKINSSLPDEESYSQIDMLNKVPEVEFNALKILEQGSERIEKARFSLDGDAVVIHEPAAFSSSIKGDLNSQLDAFRNKQSEDIILDDEEKKIVKDIIGEAWSEDTIFVYDEKKSQVVVYTDRYDNIRKFKHKLKLGTGKLKENVRSRKRFAENNHLPEGSQENCIVSVRPSEIRQDFSWSKDASDVEVFYTKENIKVAVYTANILSLPVDCIVNAANYNLQHGGGVAKVIADAAGPELVQEGNAIIKKYGKIPVGFQVTTTAGRLPYKYVIHTVGPCWSDYQPHTLQKVQQCEEDLYAAIFGCFIEAERNGLSTVALPAVSAGIYAAPQDMCAVQYAKAVLEYSQKSRQGQALKEIHFIDKLPHLVKLMQDTFRIMIENGMVPNYNIQNYVASSSNYEGKQLKETGRQGRRKKNSAVSNGQNESTKAGKFSPFHCAPIVKGTVPAENMQNSVVYSSSLPSQQSMGRKRHDKQDVAVNNSLYETSRPNKPSCVYNDHVVNGNVPIKSIQNYAAFPSSHHRHQSKETGRQGRAKQINSQYETTNPNKLCPVYYEPYENRKRHFVFQVSVNPVVRIYEGDILKLKHIDAIVCPDDSEGSGMGRIATELMDKTKYRQNKDKCFKSWKPCLGDIAITNGEETPFKVIVHVVIENNFLQGQELKSTMKKSIDNILRKTNECIQVKTIALPLFGVKQELLTDKSWGELFLDRFINFCCEVENPNLEEVHIITDVSSSSVYSTLMKVFVDYTDERNNAPSHQIIAPPRPPLPKDYTTYDLTQDPMSGQGHVSKNDKGNADDNCTVCLCPKTDPKSLPCGHSFCSECYNQMLKHKPVCAICGKIVGIITGNQPEDGRMYVRTSSMNLAGYEGHGCIEITYDFPAGRQRPDHPSPGKWYSQMTRTAYLPNTSEGKKVCRMLQLAFDRKLMFTISTSRTTGKEGLTWNDIHHKTNPKQGTQFGYPDPKYLIRVKDELAAKGITENDLPKEQTDV